MNTVQNSRSEIPRSISQTQRALPEGTQARVTLLFFDCFTKKRVCIPRVHWTFSHSKVSYKPNIIKG